MKQLFLPAFLSLITFQVWAAELCVDCVGIAGSWTGTEAGTSTTTYRGVTETQPIRGTGSFPISQQGCRFSFSTQAIDPNTGQPIVIKRNGTISGNRFTFKGVAVFGIPGATFRENYIVGTGSVAKDTMTFRVTGRATGTLDGDNFVITLSSSGNFSGSRSWCVPTIAGEPASQTVINGCPVTFRVHAQGIKMSYQWMFNGTPITRATSAAYSIAAVNPSRAGVYSVRVKNFDGVVDSAGAVLTVVESPFLAAQGTYTGLFYETERISHQSSGFLRLTVTDKGVYSARLISGGITNNFSGQFDLDGKATKILPRQNGSLQLNPLRLDLMLNLEPGAGSLVGTVTDGTWTAPLGLVQGVSDPINQPVAFDGRYTIAFPPDPENGPDGAGAGALQVDKGGKVTATGKMADGQPFAASYVAGGNGAWPFYATLYRGAGSVLGWFYFTADNDVTTETLRWVRPGVFTNSIETLGSSYGWFRTNRVLNATNAVMIFSGDGLESPITNSIVLSSNNRITTSNPMKVSLNATNGLFSGSFRVPGTRRTNQFQGAIIQDLNIGVGYFIGPQESGHVLLQPTDLP